MSAKSPCLLNRNIQYSDGFISYAGVIYRPLSSAEGLARIFHELLSRDHEDERATWQPQGIGSEAYLNGTSQEEPVLSLSKEQPRTPGWAVFDCRLEIADCGLRI